MTTTRLLSAAFLALLPLAGACGSGGGSTMNGTSDLAAAVDMAVSPPDLARVRDLTPLPDLTETGELDGGGCSIVGTWEISPGFPITLDNKGGLAIQGMAAGTYMFADPTLSITDDSSPDCMMAGKYTMAFSARCAKVTATPVADPCTERKDALTMQAWERQ